MIVSSMLEFFTSSSFDLILICSDSSASDSCCACENRSVDEIVKLTVNTLAM